MAQTGGFKVGRNGRVAVVGVKEQEQEEQGVRHKCLATQQVLRLRPSDRYLLYCTGIGTVQLSSVQYCPLI